MAVHIVKISADYRVTIPKAIRQALGLRPGQHMAVGVEGGQVQFVPIDEARALRGSLKGIDTSVVREPDRA